MYYKILSADMKDFNVQYKEGLNELNEKTIYGIKKRSGLFFMDAENVMQTCKYGQLIAEVTVPEGVEITNCGDCYRADKILITNIKPLWTVDTLQALHEQGVNLHAYQDCIFRTAAANGYLEIVQYLANHGADIHAYDDYAICFASVNGHENIVKYLIERGINLQNYKHYVMRLASQSGHPNIAAYVQHQCA